VDWSLVLLALGVLLALVGLAGVVLPALPGTPLLFAGLFLAAWAEGFAHVGGFTLAVLAVLTALGYAADFLATALGAKRFGASRRAVVGAALGGLAGLFLGLPGVLLGPFVGAVAGELSGRRGLREAGRAGLGATLGLVLGVAAKLALAFSMIGLFLLDRFLWTGG
jgi:uncharacterized protein YqgC (DUF456 family)